MARFSFIGTIAGSLNSALIASRAPRVTPEHSPQQVRAMWTDAVEQVAGVWGRIREHQVVGLTSPSRV